MPRLGVNVDHVATLRQARGGPRPDPVWAALEAEAAGCEGIVCHLREDRRHIQDADLLILRRRIRTSLNLEMACHPEIVRIACRVKPDQATLVPERRRELTTEGGLDLRAGSPRLAAAVHRLTKASIRVSLFLDPDPVQLKLARELGAAMVELHTGAYANARASAPRKRSLARLKEAARAAHSLGLIVAAGHGLDYENVRPVAEIPEVEELNIGFAIVARALEVGWTQAVREMVRLVR
ncbi:MAG: pyridoxine 5'-phosphate synthase [Candidatus Omnitrophica bacterium]|nr:pyridoxine 5'-phosphate synthase [Candidatus Omnitrophota bacterium]